MAVASVPPLSVKFPPGTQWVLGSGGIWWKQSAFYFPGVTPYSGNWGSYNLRRARVTSLEADTDGLGLPFRVRLEIPIFDSDFISQPNQGNTVTFIYEGEVARVFSASLQVLLDGGVDFNNLKPLKFGASEYLSSLANFSEFDNRYGMGLTSVEVLRVLARRAAIRFWMMLADSSMVSRLVAGALFQGVASVSDLNQYLGAASWGVGLPVYLRWRHYLSKDEAVSLFSLPTSLSAGAVEPSAGQLVSSNVTFPHPFPGWSSSNSNFWHSSCTDIWKVVSAPKDHQIRNTLSAREQLWFIPMYANGVQPFSWSTFTTGPLWDANPMGSLRILLETLASNSKLGTLPPLTPSSLLSRSEGWSLALDIISRYAINLKWREVLWNHYSEIQPLGTSIQHCGPVLPKQALPAELKASYTKASYFLAAPNIRVFFTGQPLVLNALQFSAALHSLARTMLWGASSVLFWTAFGTDRSYISPQVGYVPKKDYKFFAAGKAPLNIASYPSPTTTLGLGGAALGVVGPTYQSILSYENAFRPRTVGLDSLGEATKQYVADSEADESLGVVKQVFASSVLWSATGVPKLSSWKSLAGGAAQDFGFGVSTALTPPYWVTPDGKNIDAIVSPELWLSQARGAISVSSPVSSLSESLFSSASLLYFQSRYELLVRTGHKTRKPPPSAMARLRLHPARPATAPKRR